MQVRFKRKMPKFHEKCKNEGTAALPCGESCRAFYEKKEERKKL